MGNNVKIQNNVSLYKGIIIEDDVFIGPNATFTNDKFPRSKNTNYKQEKTLLKKGCSIGSNVTVLPGIVIGENAMVGAGTVVTKDNCKELKKIGELLKNYSIDIWKIYEFLPQNINAINNKDSLQIPIQAFKKLAEEIKKEFSDFFKVVVSKRSDRDKAYFFINSDGVVFMPLDNLNLCEEKIIGNIFDNNIVEKWELFISKENYFRNIKDTFIV